MVRFIILFEFLMRCINLLELYTEDYAAVRHPAPFYSEEAIFPE
jgi:hypothetical protein